MKQAAQRNIVDTSLPEYRVYIYYHPDEDREEIAGWERKSRTLLIRQALQEARLLHRSKSYRKVEVRKKIFSARQQRDLDIMLKVYHRRSFRITQRAALLWGVPILCALGTLLIFQYL